MKMAFKLNKFFAWSKIVAGSVCKKIHDNTIKDNITVTSSNVSRNNGMIRIFTYFLAKNNSKLPIADINLILLCSFYHFTPNLCFSSH